MLFEGLILQEHFFVLRKNRCHFAKKGSFGDGWFVYSYEKCKKIKKIKKRLDNCQKKVYNWVHKNKKQ